MSTDADRRFAQAAAAQQPDPEAERRLLAILAGIALRRARRAHRRSEQCPHPPDES